MSKTWDNDSFNYWQPATDLMTALVFILLFVILLLGLYILYKPQEHTGTDKVDRAATTHRLDTEETHHTTNGGGGGGTTIIQTGGGGDQPGAYPDTEGEKSAVFVQLVDAETNEPVTLEDSIFELYRQNGPRQTLYTYYPEKVAYRQFATTEEGNFYLPEKIPQGKYYFHNITAPDGYDLADDADFDLDDYYDWPKPFRLNIPVAPSRNQIVVTAKDAGTGEALDGAVFDIVATDDIVTADGTVRCKKGDIADTVTTKDGTATSKELYLGTYTVREKSAPTYYASAEKSQDIDVKRKGDGTTKTASFELSKTTIHLYLVDALYDKQGIADAAFDVSKKDGTSIGTFTTDETGRIDITNLEAGTDYVITQTAAAKDYQMDSERHTVTVSKAGRINGKTEATLDLQNRMIRVSIRITDTVFHQPVANMTAALYSESGDPVEQWTSDEGAKTISGIEPGKYTLEVNGRQKSVTVADSEKITNVSMTLFTTQDIAAIIGIAAVAVILLLVLKRMFRKKKNHES